MDISEKLLPRRKETAGTILQVRSCTNNINGHKIKETKKREVHVCEL